MKAIESFSSGLGFRDSKFPSHIEIYHPRNLNNIAFNYLADSNLEQQCVFSTLFDALIYCSVNLRTPFVYDF